MKEIKFTDQTKAKKIIDVFLVVAIFALCIVTVVATNNSKKYEDESATATQTNTDSVDYPEDSGSDENGITENSDAETTEDVEKTETNSETEYISVADENIVSEESLLQPPEFMLPLNGELIREYSIDKPIYNQTMDDWRIHTGIDISSQSGTDVVAAESGTVKFRGFDARLGYTVIISRNNFECIYASLESVIPVNEGDKISKGEIIGHIGSSMISEICDKAHLHFEIKIDNEYVNPEEYLNM